jgi:hypothetical protein
MPVRKWAFISTISALAWVNLNLEWVNLESGKLGVGASSARANLNLGRLRSANTDSLFPGL